MKFVNASIHIGSNEHRGIFVGDLHLASQINLGIKPLFFKESILVCNPKIDQHIHRFIALRKTF